MKKKKHRKKEKPKIVDGWEFLPMGSRRRGNWYIKLYSTGWYVWRKMDEAWGPYKTEARAKDKRKRLLAEGWRR